MSTLLLTGANRGIGSAILQKLWESQNNIDNFIVVVRSKDKLEHLKIALEQNNPYNKKLTGYIADLSSKLDVLSLTTKIIEDKQHIDILINCAGYTDPKPITQVTCENLENTFQVNFFTPYILTRELLSNGNKFSHIVNIASTAGMRGRSGWSTYCAAKAALINFTEALREELQIFGTRVISLSPGRCATDLRKTLAPDEDSSTIMQPKNVAEVVSIFLSEVGKFIDSNNIVVRK